MIEDLKNEQLIELITKMSKKSFPDKDFAECEEICRNPLNSIYRITFSDGFKSILKIQSADKSRFMKNEMDLMETEVAALNIVKGRLSVKTPEVYYFDNSCSLCPEKYIFMEELEGKRYSDVKEALAKETAERIEYKIGKLVKEIADIENPEFKTLGDNRTFSNLYDFTSFFLYNAIDDAESKKIDFSITKKELLELFEKDKRCFECDLTPAFLHHNLQKENILIKDGEVSGIINFEQAIFGDPIMEEHFRLQRYTLPFFEGYRQSQFNYKETRRLLWFDVIFYLSMMTEGAFRGYKDTSVYDYSSPLLKQTILMLNIQPF